MDQLQQLEELGPTGVRQHAEQRIPMTYGEFLARFDDSIHAEWVNGEAILFMPPSIRHQEMIVFLLALLDGFVKIFDLGKVLTAPCEMRLELSGTSREPDILFLAKENYTRLDARRINGPADLVIEVISPESAARDRSDKFYEYQANGIREYWIIDPRPRVARADFWVLDENGSYRPVPIGLDGLYHSTVLPNFRLDVHSLLSGELPNPLQALADMVGIETLLRALGPGK